MGNSPSIPPRVNILGVGVSAINMEQALEVIEGWIERGERHYVCVTNMHGVMESWRDEGLRRIHNSSGLTTPDGMPLVWLSRLKGFRWVDRVCGPDLLLALCERFITKGYKHFFYGGAPGVPERLAERLVVRFPGLKVVGTFSPPLSALTPEEDEDVVRMINEASPDILRVGLGAPKQERWMAEHRDRLQVPVMIGVGAAFDFHSGVKRQAPRWMQRAGLEWLFRLCQEPRRLWRRYLLNIPRFLCLVIAQELGIIRCEPDDGKG